MSTKATIVYGKTFHFYHECLDNDRVYLELEGTEFEAGYNRVMVPIPIHIWEVIRERGGADLSLAPLTDSELDARVEREVDDIIAQYEKIVAEGGKPWFLMGADRPRDEQIAETQERLYQRRQHQREIAAEIEGLLADDPIHEWDTQRGAVANPVSRLTNVVERQLEPAVRMLLSAIDTCPDNLWAKADGHPPVWQHALHAACYFERWMRAPGETFTLPEFAAPDAVDLTAPAEPAVDKQAIRQYFAEVSEKRLLELRLGDGAHLLREEEFDGVITTLMDRILGQVRHVMYHVGCISEILRRHTGEPLPWQGYTPRR
jgi:hypothetical protein